MTNLTNEQLNYLQKLEEAEIGIDDWEDLCRAVIVRAILDYAFYGYKEDNVKDKKLHDNAKYWIFNDTDIVTFYAIGANISVSFIRKLAKKVRENVKSGTLEIQREIADKSTSGQLSMLDLWSNMNE